MEIVDVSFGGGMSMQLTPVVVGLSSRVTTIVEGNTFVITFTTNTPSAYPYTITGVSSADIGNASLTGTFTANGETRTYTISDDLVTEGRETFLMTMDNGQAGAAIGIDDPYYILTSNVASANEGNVFTVTLVTNAVHALPVGYTISGITSNDISGTSLTGNFTSNNQVLSFTANSDITTEGVEYFFISLNNGQANANVTINDTSLTTPGQQEYTTPGTYSWVAPTGVIRVSVVTVGAGGGGGGWNDRAGGGGGGLAWGNATVTPGQTYNVVVGAGGIGAIYPTGPFGGGYSAFGSNVIFASGGKVIGYSSYGGNLLVGDGGGVGGRGGEGTFMAGGGGAGGYTGAGGAGGATGSGSSGAGGGGGGGGGYRFAGAGGGGVGIYGEGASGVGGTGGYISNADGGTGGSGGQRAANIVYGQFASAGGRFGGGGGGGNDLGGYESNVGAGGAVRIVWGAGRYYPATNTANV